MDKSNITKQSLRGVDSDLNKLADNIACLVNETKGRLSQTVNVALVATYWNIGKYIVEFEIPSYDEVTFYRTEGYKVIHALDLIKHINNGSLLNYKSK